MGLLQLFWDFIFLGIFTKYLLYLEYISRGWNTLSIPLELNRLLSWISLCLVKDTAGI